jgi:hypothetical protein
MQMDKLPLHSLVVTLYLCGRLLDSLSTWLNTQFQSYLLPSPYNNAAQKHKNHQQVSQ